MQWSATRGTGTGLRRRFGWIRPWHFRIAPTVLVAGSVAAGGRREISDEVLQTPTRVLLATGDDGRFRLGRRLMGTALRRAGLVGETIEAFVLEVTEPPVAGLATEAEALAQLGHRAEPILAGGDKVGAFSYGISSGPRHGFPAIGQHPLVVVNCHPCTRSELVPTCSVSTQRSATADEPADRAANSPRVAYQLLVS